MDNLSGTWVTIRRPTIINRRVTMATDWPLKNKVWWSALLNIFYIPSRFIHVVVFNFNLEQFPGSTHLHLLLLHLWLLSDSLCAFSNELTVGRILHVIPKWITLWWHDISSATNLPKSLNNNLFRECIVWSSLFRSGPLRQRYRSKLVCESACHNWIFMSYSAGNKSNPWAHYSTPVVFWGILCSVKKY